MSRTSMICPVCEKSDAVRCKDDPRFYKDGRLTAVCFHGHGNGHPVVFDAETGALIKHRQLQEFEKLYAVAESGTARGFGDAFLAVHCGIYQVTRKALCAASVPFPSEKDVIAAESESAVIMAAPLYDGPDLVGLEMRRLETRNGTKVTPWTKTLGGSGIYIANPRIQPKAVVVFEGIWDAVAGAFDAFNHDSQNYAFASVKSTTAGDLLKRTLDAHFPGVPVLIITDQDPAGKQARARLKKAGTLAVLQGVGLAKDYREAEPKARWNALMEGVEAALNVDPKDDAKMTPAGLALALIDQAGAELFHDPEGEGYLSVKMEGRLQTMRLRSKATSELVQGLCWTKCKMVLKADAAREVQAVLGARAVHEGPEMEAFVRVARHEGAVYLDLGDATRKVVRVDPAGFGWEILDADQVPVRFLRPAGLRALPMPAQGGSITELRPFLNTDKWGFILIVSWGVAALGALGQYPVLVINGEAGSGKTLISAASRRLVDPSKVNLSSKPQSERDLYITARNSHAIVLNNLSGIEPWLSDAICGLALGSGFRTRELHSDSDELLIEAARPVIVNGIPDLARQTDLQDRSLPVTLHRLEAKDRKPERELWAAFDEAHPRILGALLDLVSHAHAHAGAVEMPEPPRLADFAHFMAAAELGLCHDAGGIFTIKDGEDWRPGDFLDAYTGAQKDVSRATADDDCVAAALVKMAGKGPWRWTGKATELLKDLTAEIRPDPTPKDWHPPRDWPKTSTVLSTRLRRAATALRNIGFGIDFDRSSDPGRSRNISLSFPNLKESASSASSASRTSDSNGPGLDDPSGPTVQGASRMASNVA